MLSTTVAVLDDAGYVQVENATVTSRQGTVAELHRLLTTTTPNEGAAAPSSEQQGLAMRLSRPAGSPVARTASRLAICHHNG